MYGKVVVHRIFEDFNLARGNFETGALPLFHQLLEQELLALAELHLSL